MRVNSTFNESWWISVMLRAHYRLEPGLVRPWLSSEGGGFKVDPVAISDGRSLPRQQCDRSADAPISFRVADHAGVLSEQLESKCRARSLLRVARVCSSHLSQ